MSAREHHQKITSYVYGKKTTPKRRERRYFKQSLLQRAIKVTFLFILSTTERIIPGEYPTVSTTLS